MALISDSADTFCSELETAMKTPLRRSQRLSQKINNTQTQTNVIDNRCDISENLTENYIDLQEEVMIPNAEKLSEYLSAAHQEQALSAVITNNAKKTKCTAARKTRKRISNAVNLELNYDKAPKVSNENIAKQQTIETCSANENMHIDLIATNAGKDNLLTNENTQAEHALSYSAKEAKPKRVARKSKTIVNYREDSAERTSNFCSKYDKSLPNLVVNPSATITQQNTNLNELSKQPSVTSTRKRAPIRRRRQLKTPTNTRNTAAASNKLIGKQIATERRNNDIDFLEQNNFANTTSQPFRMKQYIEHGQVRIYPQNVMPTESMLPPIYPPHFVNQHIEMPPRETVTMPKYTKEFGETVFPTPELSCDLPLSSGSTPSLPDSLRGVFDTDDIREILNIEKIAYRLTEKHVQMLAIMLNIKYDYLRELLQRILQVNVNFLQNVDVLLKVLPDMKEKFNVKKMSINNADSDSEASAESVIETSQSPVKRHLISQSRC